MRIEQLRSFLTVYETLSFRAAAERLYVSQSVITRHVSQLEEELGGALFTRTTRKVIPTKAGEQFYKKIRRAMLQIDGAIAEFKALTDKKTRVRVGYEYFYMDHHSPPWLEEFKASCNNEIAIDVVEQSAPQLFDSLSEGKLDCVFIGLTREQVVPTHLCKLLIANMDECIYVGKTHPLSNRSFLVIDDILEEEFVYPAVRPTSRESVIVRDFEEAGKTQRSSITLHLPSALRMVELGSAIIDFPEEFIVDDPQLVRIPYKSENQIAYQFIWNRANNGEAFKQFLAFVEKKVGTTVPATA